MPTPARPYSNEPTPALEGSVQLRRFYCDPLGRPLSGTVQILGRQGQRAGHIVALPAPLTATLVNGWLDVLVVPDTYRLVANLVGADGTAVTDDAKIVVA